MNGLYLLNASYFLPVFGPLALQNLYHCTRQLYHCSLRLHSIWVTPGGGGGGGQSVISLREEGECAIIVWLQEIADTVI